MTPDDFGSSRGSWPGLSAPSFRDVLAGVPDDVFGSRRWEEQQEEEEELRWAAIERLPTFERLRKGVLRRVLEDGKMVENEVDLHNMGRQDRKVLVDTILRVVDQDNEKFLRRLRDRIDK